MRDWIEDLSPSIRNSLPLHFTINSSHRLNTRSKVGIRVGESACERARERARGGERKCLALVYVMVKTPDHRTQAHFFQLHSRKEAVVNLSLVEPFDLGTVREAKGVEIRAAITTRLSMRGGASHKTSDGRPSLHYIHVCLLPLQPP